MRGGGEIGRTKPKPVHIVLLGTFLFVAGALGNQKLIFKLVANIVIAYLKSHCIKEDEQCSERKFSFIGTMRPEPVGTCSNSKTGAVVQENSWNILTIIN